MLASHTLRQWKHVVICPNQDQAKQRQKSRKWNPPMSEEALKERNKKRNNNNNKRSYLIAKNVIFSSASAVARLGRISCSLFDQTILDFIPIMFGTINLWSECRPSVLKPTCAYDVLLDARFECDLVDRVETLWTISLGIGFYWFRLLRWYG